MSAPVSEPGRFTPTHLWLAAERADRNIRASSGRSPERESLVGSPGRVRGARPRPEPAPPASRIVVLLTHVVYVSICTWR